MKHADLSERLGYRFRQPELLQRALTHRSYSQVHNERLEFLGDSVLNCVVAKYLYDAFPDQPEGNLSRFRSRLVSRQTLVGLARQLGLGGHLALGEGERRSAGHDRPSILADTLEAVFGAVMLDGGFAEAERVILGLYVPLISNADPGTFGKDAKTVLQEFLQGRGLPLPRYSVLEMRGEAHAQIFVVACELPTLRVKTQGEGNSRRVAEQIAAEKAYQLISRV